MKYRPVRRHAVIRFDTRSNPHTSRYISVEVRDQEPIFSQMTTEELKDFIAKTQAVLTTFSTASAKKKQSREDQAARAYLEELISLCYAILFERGEQ